MVSGSIIDQISLGDGRKRLSETLGSRVLITGLHAECRRAHLFKEPSAYLLLDGNPFLTTAWIGRVECWAVKGLFQTGYTGIVSF
jgi:hypothetical protein